MSYLKRALAWNVGGILAGLVMGSVVVLAQSTPFPPGWGHANGYVVGPLQSAPPCSTVNGGMGLYADPVGHLAMLNGATCTANSILPTVTRTGALADAGGGQSKAVVVLPFATTALCNCNDTSTPITGSGFSVWTDGGGQLNITSTGGADGYACNCTGG